MSSRKDRGVYSPDSHDATSPSPILTGSGVSPWTNFGIKDARSLHHVGEFYSILSLPQLPYFVSPPPAEDFRYTLFVAGGAFGRRRPKTRTVCTAGGSRLPL